MGAPRGIVEGEFKAWLLFQVVLLTIWWLSSIWGR